MEGVALYYFNNDNVVREVNSSHKFYSYPSEYKNQNAPGTHIHMIKIYQKLMDQYTIKPNQSTVWKETYGCTNKFRFTSYIYLIKSFR